MTPRPHELKPYRITPNEYDAILDAQGGGCAICTKVPKRGEPRLAVDHRHCDGLDRGLLCHRCNYQLLGQWGEDPEFYERAAEYLRRPPAVRVIGQRYVVDAPPPGLC